MKRALRLGVLSAIGLLLLSAVGVRGARADDISDTQIAVSTCAVDPVTLAANLLANTGFITFKSGTTGTLTLYCPITSELHDFNHIEVTYQDGNSTTTGSNVTVTLLPTSKSGFFIFATTLFNSDLVASTTWHNQNLATGAFVLDHVNNYYQLKVVLTRTSSGTAESIGHIRLFDVVQ